MSFPSSGTGGGGGSSDTLETTQVLVKTAVQAINTATGTVTASPTANTILARLKDLLTGITLAAGSAIIGEVGIDQTTPGTTDSVTIKASVGIGSLTETAPASDTASSGLNGRLQRIAQNLTSLLTGTVLAAGSNLIGAISQTTASVTTTTMLNAVSASGTGTVLDVSGKSVAVIDIRGTFVGTVTFECSSNDTNWDSINATKLGSDTLSITATATGQYRISCGGLKSIRCNLAWTSGTSITAVGRSTLADSHAKVISLGGNTGMTINPTISVSTAYEASRQALAVAGNLLSITGYNSKTSAQFIQIHNVSSTPADAQVPVDFFTVPAQSSFNYTPNDIIGDAYTVGIYICNSSTGPTKTIGSADCWFRVRTR